MEEIDLAAQTLFAELLQRSLDAEFDAEYRENGTFVRRSSVRSSPQAFLPPIHSPAGS